MIMNMARYEQETITPIFEIGCFHKNPTESFIQTLVRFVALC